ncbi:MAG: c4-dicarboxylate-binding protein [Alphaproteobacteria bacterium]|nr:MAG: c4-dicarboxylate-binding protein [Alphaproteobacteria bacterium]
MAKMEQNSGARADSSSRRPWGKAGGVLALLVIAVALMRYLLPADSARLDLSLPWNPREFHTLNAARYARLIAERTDGRVKIVVHPAAVLGIKGPGSLGAVERGAVAMVEMAAFQQSGEEPLFGLDSLPFLVRNRRELRLLLDSMRPLIEQRLARRGLALIYMVPWPAQNIFADRPLRRLEDFRGLRVRTLDANTTRLARALAMAPMQLASADVVPALASGALDAVMTSTTTAAAQQYWQFLCCIHRTNHGWVTNYLVVRRRALQSLSPEDRTLLFRLGQSLEEEFWAASRRDDAEKRRLLIARGMRDIPLSAPLRQQLEARARPLWHDFANRVPQARPLIDDFLLETGRQPLGRAEEDA